MLGLFKGYIMMRINIDSSKFNMFHGIIHDRPQLPISTMNDQTKVSTQNLQISL